MSKFTVRRIVTDAILIALFFALSMLSVEIPKKRFPFSRVIRATSSGSRPLRRAMASATKWTRPESFRRPRKGSGDI